MDSCQDRTVKRSALSRRGAFLRGQRAEEAVAEKLESEGWRVRARNWRGNGAELDLVVERNHRVRFVEVKARGLNDPGALDAVTADKRRRLTRCAEAWLDLHAETYEEAAFLVAVVTMAPEGWSITWIDDAFDAT